MAKEQLPELEEECFFIAPIGAEDSETRDRSDGVLEYIVSPAAHSVGLTTIRADKIAKPGQITRQVIEHVVGAKAAVVDLTGANPNVYYEMAIRHTAQLPTVLIAQDGEELPFDIAQMRTIFFDPTSLKSAAACREQISQHLAEALGGEVDSPIAASMSVQKLGQGNEQERVLAQLVDGMDDLRHQVRLVRTARHDRIPPGFVRDLDLALHELTIYRDRTGGSDPAIEEIVDHLQRPLRWASRGEYRSRGGWRQSDLGDDPSASADRKRSVSKDASELNTGDTAEIEAIERGESDEDSG